MPSSPCHNPFLNLKGHCQKDIRKRIRLSLPYSIYGERMERHSTINLTCSRNQIGPESSKERCFGSLFARNEKKNYGVKRIHSTKNHNTPAIHP